MFRLAPIHGITELLRPHFLFFFPPPSRRRLECRRAPTKKQVLKNRSCALHMTTASENFIKFRRFTRSTVDYFRGRTNLARILRLRPQGAISLLLRVVLTRHNVNGGR